ncbi:DUF1206 domain-containing protein [Devosia oryzisoli]|nr:DUF1206 domain-containing protein [Devosia oryzisoli]
MSNKFELLARWGYTARGAVYAILGALALTAAASGGSSSQDSPKDALSSLLGQPFGQILLGIVAIGLVGHVLWRFAQAFLNADHLDNDAKGYLVRAGSLISGLANLSLAFAACSLAISASSGSGSGSGGEESISAWLMQQPFGQVLVGAVGVGLIIGGGAQVWRGFSGQYRKRVKLPQDGEAALNAICVFGLSARGILLAISGGFFIYAALTVNPEQAGGLSDGLAWVRQLPFGLFLYGLAAIGLIAFGVYSGIEGRYRKVDAPDSGDVKQAANKMGSLAGH